ncbi:MAG: FecR family protein [Oscillatoriaceae bacterium SKW80]|nr:FecR family protein [Oscillatoriaceae bacterium SKYG93]MCX8121697.1 FecR family protein [Oscillatoriaceae bacterium SKW80]MDW8454006.1 FecR domain-containing protein [Oscillatoriaceae cyanobacterium SKYGB_i_bin93]HIK28750.1 FecR domain-containing protein [Oscillatoriaceae cyanobacterium M7585_C2015_266]
MLNFDCLSSCRLSPKIAILSLSVGAVALIIPIWPTAIAKANPPEEFSVAQQQTGERAIIVEEVKGTVTYGPSMQAVTVGQRLRAGEDELRTGQNSTVRLYIDNHIGSLEVAENTTLKIKTLSKEKTSLFVWQGRVRASIGKTIRTRNSQKQESKGENEKYLIAQRNSSRGNYPIDIQTPAGIAGVQGTCFGVNVGPTGKTGISTLEGSVVAIAQGQEIVVNKGQYVVIEPGKAPTKPEKAPTRAAFRLLSVRKIGDNGIRIIGQASPHELVYVNGIAVETDIEGKFSIIIPRPLNRRVRFVLRGPIVTETYYEIAVL